MFVRSVNLGNYYYYYCFFLLLKIFCKGQKHYRRGTLTKNCSENCSKCKGENPCRSAMSAKLQSIVIDIRIRDGCFHVNCRVFSEYVSTRTPLRKHFYWKKIYHRQDVIDRESHLCHSYHLCPTSFMSFMSKLL